MALIFKARNAVFSNFVANLSPAVNPASWYDFGISEEKSLTNLVSSGFALSVFGATAGGIDYNSDHISLPQNSTGEDFLRSTSEDFRVCTFAFFNLDGGQFERLFTFPSGGGLQVASNGELGLGAILNGDTATSSIATALRSRPFTAVASINEDIGANTVTFTLSVKYSDDVSTVTSETFSGSLDSVYSSTIIDLGRNSVGHCNTAELLFYDRILSPSEVLTTQNYLLAKYIS